MSYEEFRLLGNAEQQKRFLAEDEEEQKAKRNKEQGQELEYPQEFIFLQRTAKDVATAKDIVTEKKVRAASGESLIDREMKLDHSKE